jgi:hypothetical protein
LAYLKQPVFESFWPLLPLGEEQLLHLGELEDCFIKVARKTALMFLVFPALLSDEFLVILYQLLYILFA